MTMKQAGYAQEEYDAGCRVFEILRQDEAIECLTQAQKIRILKVVTSFMEGKNPFEKTATDTPKVSKQAMKATREYIGSRIALALWVSPQEKKGLQAMGYDPDDLICIERFNDETVFLQARYAGPICLSRKDGGGRKSCSIPVTKNGLSIYEKEATRFMADLIK